MKQPHILFVFADQLRYDALACNGNTVVRTPNIDRLAREGVVFDQAYSSCPICSPYRAQVLTGNYSHVNGVMCNEYRLFDNQRTLAHRMKELGYRTAYVGKWHLGYPPYPEHRRYGFDDMLAYNCIHSYYEVSYYHNEKGPMPMVQFAPVVESELALDYLKRHGSGRNAAPVCLLLSWGPPHWNALRKPRRYGDYPQQYNLYRPEQIELSPNVPIQFRDYSRRDTADYYGMVTALDASIGRIVEELDRTGLAEDTILCFTSDHGDHLNSHGYGTPGDQWMHHSLRGSKATPYTESCHIPFVLRYPARVAGNRRTDTFFNSVDVLPTLMELAGLQAPADVQGRSVAHAALGREGENPDSVYLQILGTGWPDRERWLGLWRGLRTRSHMYARWHDLGGRRLLFDVASDPAELRNLAGDPRHAELEARMETLLQEWTRKTGDPFDSGPRLPVTQMLDLGQAPITRDWLPRMPPAYAAAVRDNHRRFKTGEQEGEPGPGLR